MIGEANRFLLLNCIRKYDPIFRTAIVHTTGLSAMNVSTIVDALLVEKASEITDGVQAAQPDDLFCKVALEFAGMSIGIALANLMNVLNPSLILIDGSSRRAGLLLLEPIPQSRAAYSLPDFRENTRVLPGALGDDATSLGGVAVVLDAIFGTDSATSHPLLNMRIG